MPMAIKTYVKCILLIPAVFYLALFLSSCAQLPLKREHGYPADWPKLVALSKGGQEINGTYANKGVAIKSNGNIESISLSSLIPRPRLSKSLTLNGDTSSDTVKFTVLPPKGWLGVTHIKADINSLNESYEFELGSDKNVLLYLVTLESKDLYLLGFSSHQVRVFLTVGEDNSLIAKIHEERFKQFLLYMDYSSNYVWAKFERIQHNN